MKKVPGQTKTPLPLPVPVPVPVPTRRYSTILEALSFGSTPFCLQTWHMVMHMYINFVAFRVLRTCLARELALDFVPLAGRQTELLLAQPTHTLPFTPPLHFTWHWFRGGG